MIPDSKLSILLFSSMLLYDLDAFHNFFVMKYVTPANTIYITPAIILSSDPENNKATPAKTIKAIDRYATIDKNLVCRPFSSTLKITNALRYFLASQHQNH